METAEVKRTVPICDVRESVAARKRKLGRSLKQKRKEENTF
jgi:hypothetical protein